MISPTVAFTLAASTASSKRLPVLFSAALVRFLSFSITIELSLSALLRANLSSCLFRTKALSTFKTSIFTSSWAAYRFTPTMTWRPESIRACVRAAASSILILGIPASIAFAIPPRSSISSICCNAFLARS